METQSRRKKSGATSWRRKVGKEKRQSLCCDRCTNISVEGGVYCDTPVNLQLLLTRPEMVPDPDYQILPARYVQQEREKARGTSVKSMPATANPYLQQEKTQTRRTYVAGQWA